jgi:AcrR family transcriptional regulator
MNETKVRILDAAERLIADHGFEVSLRTITSEAHVNLAAVNYHFQSKDALIDAVVARRIEPVNNLRIRMLDEIEQAHPAGALPLEEVLRAFVSPALTLPERSHIRVLFGRLYGAPDEFVRRLFEPHLRPLAARFMAAFERSAVEMPREELSWCLIFSIGIMVNTLTWSRLAPEIGASPAESDPNEVTERIVRFAAAGFRAAARGAVPEKRVRHA